MKDVWKVGDLEVLLYGSEKKYVNLEDISSIASDGWVDIPLENLRELTEVFLDILRGEEDRNDNTVT